MVAVVASALLMVSSCAREPRAVTIEEVLASQIAERIEVRGVVSPSTLIRAEQITTFEISADGGRSLRVRARGVVPDTLYEGNEGAFTGTMMRDDRGWILEADRLILRTGRRR